MGWVSLFATEIGWILDKNVGQALSVRPVQPRLQPGTEFMRKIFGQAEMHPASFLLGVDQSGVLKLLQMTRHRGAGDPQPFGDLAGAQIRVMKQRQDHLETVSIGERFELCELNIHV